MEIFNSLNNYNFNEDILILGDFNAPDINWSTVSASSAASITLCELVFQNNLLQIIPESTHLLGDVLDLILTNSPARIMNITINTPKSL